MRTHSCGMHARSSSPTRDQTRAPCFESTESYPLDHQGSPSEDILKIRCAVTSLETSRNDGNPVVFWHLQSQEPGTLPPAPEKLNQGHQPSQTPLAISDLSLGLQRLCWCLPVEPGVEKGQAAPLDHLWCMVGESSDSRGSQTTSTTY